MPILMSVDRRQKTSFVQHIGTIKDDEFIAAYRSFFTDPEYCTAKRRIVDFRHASADYFTVRTLKVVDEILRQSPAVATNSTQVAIIAPSMGVGMSKFNTLQTGNEMKETRVFSNLDLAVQWLNLVTNPVH